MGNSQLRVIAGRGTVYSQPWNPALAHLHVLALRGAPLL